MVSGFLVSTIATGLLLLGVAVFLREFRKWRHDKPAAEASGFDALATAMQSQRVWMAAYAIIVVASLGATYAFIGGSALPESLANVGIIGLVAVLGLGLFALVVGGTYAAVRGNGRSSAQAAGMSAAAVGFFVLALVAVKLVVA